VGSAGASWKKNADGERVRFGDTLEAEITSRGEFGERTLRFLTGADVYAAVEQIGHVPLPPYIKRHDTPADRERYQTVYARERGSVAAPTAGPPLHSRSDRELPGGGRGDRVCHAARGPGYVFSRSCGTARNGAGCTPSATASPPRTQPGLNAARRLVAVGTTSVRSIESSHREEFTPGECARPKARSPGRLICSSIPGFRFARTGALLTNFHLPRTSLLLLACAFGGTDLVLGAYRHAIEKKYRFYSYGDCMLIV